MKLYEALWSFPRFLDLIVYEALWNFPRLMKLCCHWKPVFRVTTTKGVVARLKDFLCGVGPSESPQKAWYQHVIKSGLVVFPLWFKLTLTLTPCGFGHLLVFSSSQVCFSSKSTWLASLVIARFVAHIKWKTISGVVRKCLRWSRIIVCFKFSKTATQTSIVFHWSKESSCAESQTPMCWLKWRRDSGLCRQVTPWSLALPPVTLTTCTVIVKMMWRKSRHKWRYLEELLQVQTPFPSWFVSTSRELEGEREPVVDLSYMRSSSFRRSIASAVTVLTSGNTASGVEPLTTAVMLLSGKTLLICSQFVPFWCQCCFQNVVQYPVI